MTAEPLSYCGQEVQARDRERFLTCLFAPAGQREALFTLYAFNLEVAKTAEVVSEPMLGRIRLQWWREALDGIYGGKPRKHAVVEPLSEIVKYHELPRSLFDRIIDGRELDLEETPLPDLTAFKAYTADTSGALLQLAARVLGVKEEPAFQAAQDIGIAWAMTGLVRAVPFHAARKRCFLPDALIEKHQLSRGDLFELRSSEALTKISREIADMAQQHLQNARGQRRHFSRATLAAVLPGAIARQHLKNLERAAWDPLNPRAQGPNHGLAFRVFLAYLLRRY